MQKKAFTLIELLVVIAIIALLLSILMPSLKAAKRIARTVVCQTNVKQWGLVTTLFAQDNDNKLFKRDTSTPLTDQRTSWIGESASYIQDSDIRICPAAAKSEDRADDMANYGSITKQWGSLWTSSLGVRAQGSYGINEWASCSPGASTNEWRKTTAGGASNIPLILDASYFAGRPTNENVLQTDRDARIGTRNDNAMQLFNVDRHKDNVNVVYLDGSSSKVTLKGLWRLKWHKNFTTQGYTGTWPTWMRSMKE
jgi:prepilin-type N-terminal cleavage/methylation domain-containing protein/prepilin-type processing-associated H-X9-DG protein